MANDWFLLEYEKKTYLHNKALSFRLFPCDSGTHGHCELCWARFSEYSSDLHSGYYEQHSKSWICVDCYKELAQLFGWTIEDP